MKASFVSLLAIIGLASAASSLPTCAVKCVSSNLSQGGCSSITDTTCLCGAIDKIYTASESCLKSSCSTIKLKAAQAAVSEACGKSVGGSSSSSSASSASGSGSSSATATSSGSGSGASSATSTGSSSDSSETASSSGGSGGSSTDSSSGSEASSTAGSDSGGSSAGDKPAVGVAVAFAALLAAL